VLKLQLSHPALVILGSILIIIVLAVVYHGAIDRQMRRWKLLPEPEKLTELYFTNPNSLPSKYTPGQVQTVSFTTHNLEYANTSYKYVITENDSSSNKSVNLASGNFRLPLNGYEKKSVSISTVDLGQNVNVKVDLVNQNESIDYLLARFGQ
jgi:hypothetical protein